jgi:hypothetical protein
MLPETIDSLADNVRPELVNTVWRSQPEGRNLHLPDPAGPRYRMLLETLAKKYYKELTVLFVDRAGNNCSDELKIPANILLLTRLS